jgi:hypothetical protein
MTRPTILLNCALLLLASLASSNQARNSPQSNGQEFTAKQADAGPKAEKQASERVRVAEGEYQVYKSTDEGGIGPFSPSVYSFRESWTLWRLPDASLEVQGERNYESPQYEPHMDAFSAKLSPQFKVLQVTELKKLRWRPDSGPLTCNFLPRKLDCSSGARNPRQNIHLSLPLHAAYGFLWPISAFSLANITRFADRRANSPIVVDMLSVDEPNKNDPMFAMVLEGTLRFLKREQIRVAGQKWPADEFELKVPMQPPFIIWTSAQGLLLDFTEEDNQNRLKEHGMKLVQYKQLANF